MKMLGKHEAFVKDQIFIQEKLANRFRETEWRAQKHLDNAKHMRELLSDLIKADELLANIDQNCEGHGTGVVSHGVAMRSEDLENLPQELLAELSLSDTDKLEFEIIEILRSAGGVLPLNKILIGLYRKTGVVHKRPAITSRLYRMVQRDRLHNVADRKGIYSINSINAEDVDGMFAGESSDDDDE